MKVRAWPYFALNKKSITLADSAAARQLELFLPFWLALPLCLIKEQLFLMLKFMKLSTFFDHKNYMSY